MCLQYIKKQDATRRNQTQQDAIRRNAPPDWEHGDHEENKR
jgi:hypothetical protein